MTVGDWLEKNKKKIVRFMFLIPILAVAAISISHVVSWYDLANPISWAIYLSIAVEIAAMSAIAATSVRIRGASVWLVFGIVTLIQFIGNIFFCYADIDILSVGFATWVELTYPVFEAIGSDMEDIVAQRRWLATLQGGLLPLISLTCLHFFIQYDEEDEIDNTEDHILIEEEIIGVPLDVDDKELLVKASENVKVSKDTKPKEAIKKEPSELNAKDKTEIEHNKLSGGPDKLLRKNPPKKKNGFNLSDKMKRIIGK